MKFLPVETAFIEVTGKSPSMSTINRYRKGSKEGILLKTHLFLGRICAIRADIEDFQRQTDEAREQRLREKFKLPKKPKPPESNSKAKDDLDSELG